MVWTKQKNKLHTRPKMDSREWTNTNTHTHIHIREKNGTPIIQLKKHTPPSTTTKLQRNAEKSVFNMNWMEDLWLLISVASIRCFLLLLLLLLLFAFAASKMVWKVTVILLAAICIRCISYLFEWQTWTVFVDVYARAYYCLKHALQMEQAKQSNEWNKKPTKQHSHTHTAILRQAQDKILA